MTEEDILDLESFYGRMPTNMLRHHFPASTKKAIADAMSNPSHKRFLISRHPFVRLVSAFRDKLERYIPKYYDEIGYHIVSKYRIDAKEKFPEFEFRTATDRDGDEVSLPMFWEFVQDLLTKAEGSQGLTALDEHWRPASKMCHVCQHDYEYMLKFEDLKQEQQFFGEIIGFREEKYG